VNCPNRERSKREHRHARSRRPSAAGAATKDEAAHFAGTVCADATIFASRNARRIFIAVFIGILILVGLWQIAG
jgi:hypothetical protein